MVSKRPWARIAKDLRRAINAGQYRPGDRLPTGNEIMAQWGVARQTAQNAIDQLRAEGLVVSRPA